MTAADTVESREAIVYLCWFFQPWQQTLLQ